MSGSVTIGDVGVLRRLVQGDLRSDGVTELQRERLDKLCGLGLVERMGHRRALAGTVFRYVITAEGLEATR